MHLDQFWQIIAASRPNREAHPETCYPRLVELLQELPADEIVEWNHIFDRLAREAYSADQTAACILINTGAGDDGFYYYRCWLIGMGREVYENALANPDSLAEVVAKYPGTTMGRGRNLRGSLRSLAGRHGQHGRGRLPGAERTGRSGRRRLGHRRPDRSSPAHAAAGGVV